MSNRLAISAALSVLMMSIYVLFGSDAARTSLLNEDLAPKVGMPVPEVSLDTGRLFR